MSLRGSYKKNLLDAVSELIDRRGLGSKRYRPARFDRAVIVMLVLLVIFVVIMLVYFEALKKFFS